MLNFDYHLLIAHCVDWKAQAPGKLVSINSISRENSGRLTVEAEANFNSAQQIRHSFILVKDRIVKLQAE